jgi:transposase-like protein
VDGIWKCRGILQHSDIPQGHFAAHCNTVTFRKGISRHIATQWHSARAFRGILQHSGIPQGHFAAYCNTVTSRKGSSRHIATQWYSARAFPF